MTLKSEPLNKFLYRHRKIPYISFIASSFLVGCLAKIALNISLMQKIEKLEALCERFSNVYNVSNVYIIKHCLHSRLQSFVHYQHNECHNMKRLHFQKPPNRSKI